LSIENLESVVTRRERYQSESSSVKFCLSKHQVRASLVGRGLEVEIQQAMDLIQVIRKNPLQQNRIDLKGDKETEAKLLQLLNVIMERRALKTPPDNTRAISHLAPTTGCALWRNILACHSGRASRAFARRARAGIQ
jgi:hypothetical protein